MNERPTAGAEQDALQAVYYIHQLEQDAVNARLEPVLQAPIPPERVRYFSSWGNRMTPQTAFKPCAHYLAPLDSGFKRAFVLKSAIPLFVCPGLVAVLGTMLSRMGPGSELFVESSDTLRRAFIPAWLKLRAVNRQEEWLRRQHVAELLPSAVVEAQPNGAKAWFKIRWAEGLDRDIAALNSVYPTLAGKFDAFKETLIESGHRNADPDEAYGDSAENEFIYSMHWTLETGGMVRRIFREYNLTSPMHGLDIGGSTGFLACELAAQGHTMTNLELKDWRVEKVQPWLAQTTGVSDRVAGIAQRMEDMTGADEAYDFICLMGSLLCCTREQLPDVLNQVMRMLKPGGLIIVRENLLTDETKAVFETNVANRRFTPTELNTALIEHASEPTYYCHNGFQRTFDDVRNRWMIYAVSRKGGGGPAVASKGRGRSLLDRVVSLAR